MADGNALCEALTYVGLTISGLCGGSPAEGIYLPPTDRSVFEYKKPMNEVVPSEPTVKFPAAVVEKTVEVEKIVREEADPAEIERLAQLRASELFEAERRRQEEIAKRKADLARQVREAIGDDAIVAIGKALEYNAGLRRAQTVSLEGWEIGSEEAALFGGFDIGPEAKTNNGDESVVELNEGFVRYKSDLGLQDGKYEWKDTDGGPPIDNSYILTTDRFIKAVTQNSINSQIGEGEVVLTVKEDVYGYHSRDALIPKGTALVCDYQGPEVIGESRIQFNCKRALLAETRREILISSPVGDMQGSAGLSGEVDDRNWEKYGSAILMTAMSASIQYLGTKIVTSSGGTDSAEGQAVNAATSDLGEKFGEITAAMIEQTIDLKPIVRISSGTTVHIKPLKDWYIRPVEKVSGR